MIRGKCVSSAVDFDPTLWPTLFSAAPILGDIVYQLPEVVGKLNTYDEPLVTDSTSSMTVSGVAHRMGIFLGELGYYWGSYIEVTLT